MKQNGIEELDSIIVNPTPLLPPQVGARLDNRRGTTNNSKNNPSWNSIYNDDKII